MNNKNSFLDKLKNQDPIITVCIILLSLIGLLNIYSATFTVTSAYLGKGSLDRQVLYILAGLIIYYVLFAVNIDLLKNKLVISLIAVSGILSLTAVLLFGQDINEVRRWITIAGVQLQPSEFAKICIVLFNSFVLSHLWNHVRNEIEDSKSFLSTFFKRKAFYIFLYLALTSIYFSLVFLQPSLGNGFILFMISLLTFVLSFPYQKSLWGFAIILFFIMNAYFNIININFLYNLLNFTPIKLAGIDLILLSISLALSTIIALLLRINPAVYLVALLLAILAPISINTVWNSSILKDYQKNRIMTFLDPSIDADKKNGSYQLEQSKVAISSGGIWGKGYLQGTQTKLGFLPFAHTDFAYASIAEEFGIIGTIFLIGTYLLIILRSLKIASKSNDLFDSYLIYGIIIILSLHIFVNIGTNIGIVVNTGITLPFVSYGGSAIISMFILFSLVQMVAIKNKEHNIDTNNDMMLTSKSPWREDF